MGSQLEVLALVVTVVGPEQREDVRPARDRGGGEGERPVTMETWVVNQGCTQSQGDPGVGHQLEAFK